MSSSSFPVLTTNRYFLRELEIKDAPEIYLLRSDDIVNEFIYRTRATSLSDAVAFIEKIRLGRKENQWVFWGIVPRDEKKIVGTACLWNFDLESKKSEIGYELLPAYHGNGIMRETIPVIINFGFSVLKFRELDAWIHRNNIRSINLMEKNGFSRSFDAEKEIPPEEGYENMIIYKLKNTAHEI